MRQRVLLFTMAALIMMGSLTACGGQRTEPTIEPTPTATIQPEETAPAKTPAPESPAPSQVPVPTKNPSVDKPNFDELSDDQYAFQVQINDVVYQFPMTYAQFTSLGWEYKDDDGTMLGSKHYTVGERFVKDKMECTVHILNIDVNELPFRDCLIGGIDLDYYMTRNAPDTTIVLPKGITFGVSTADDVRAAYGSPSYENKLDGGTEIVEYRKEYDQEIKMTFDPQTGLLSNIRVENYVIPDDFVAGEVSGDVPAIVGQYEAPKAMSNDFADWIVDYGGKLYALPAPVSEFVDDGWVIDEKESTMVIDGRGSAWMLMRKDNQKLKIIVDNYSENATAVTNCFVGRVLSDPYDAKVPLIIAKNITIGTPEADVKSALAGEDVEESDSASYYLYDVRPTGKAVHWYEIYISKETSSVYKIEVKHDPSFRDYVNR